MSMSRDTIGNVPLDEFVKTVSGVYKRQDKKRSIWDVWLHANHHAAAIGEEVRKSKPGEKLLVEIADFSMWLFTFAGKIRGTYQAVNDDTLNIEEFTIRSEMEFSDIIWNKYPKLCPVCFWNRVKIGLKPSDPAFIEACDCLVHEVEDRDQSKKRVHVVKLRNYAKDNLDKKPISVDDWQNMFRQIFEANLRNLKLADIAFHLLEEVGEVSDSMVRMYTFHTGHKGDFKRSEPKWRQVWLEEELADVTSWLFTLVNSLRFVPEIVKDFQKYLFGTTALQMEPEFKLSRIIWNKYGNQGLTDLFCPYCGEKKCKCSIVLVNKKEYYDKMVRYSDVDILKGKVKV